MRPRPPSSPLFPYTTLFRSSRIAAARDAARQYDPLRINAVLPEQHIDTRHQVMHHPAQDRKSTRLNSSHGYISYAVFCLKKKKKKTTHQQRLQHKTATDTTP